MSAAAELPDAPPPYAGVVFDCDSTLSAIEGIDELAGARRDEIGDLTRRAMEGELRLEDVYRSRLELLRPSRRAVLEVGRLYVEQRLAWSAELVLALRALEKSVWIVSGGLAPAVQILADSLGVDAEHTLAVQIDFDADGAYRGFDQRSPLATQEGKRSVLAQLARGVDSRGLAFVGDGASDLCAADVVRRFVAFGGVVRRESVLARARQRSLAPHCAELVPLLLSPAERASLADDPRLAPLLAASLPFDLD